MKVKDVLVRAALVAAPLVLFFLVELGLRAAGVGEAARTRFMTVPGREDYLVLNPDFVARYFQGFAPGIAYSPFLKEKPVDGFRVFALGESSTLGYPYQFYDGFPGRLQERLQAAMPGRQVEVVNLGVTAVSSFSMWDLRHAVVAQRPDAVVIYAGHNEYYGSFGAGSNFGVGSGIWLKRLVLRLKDWAIYGALEQGMASLTGGAEGDSRTIMAAAVREADIALDSDLYRAGLAQFEANLETTLETFRDAGIPVYVATLTSNLKDQPPLGDDPNALAAYRQGLELLRKGDTTRARAAFIDAKERDGIRFRAPEALNESILRLRGRPGVTLVDVRAAFRRSSPGSVEGARLFDDHLHPNHAGYDLVAAAFFEALGSHPALATLRHHPQADAPTIDPLDAAHAAIQIARLKGGYPFKKDVSPADEERAFAALLKQRLHSGRYADSLAVLVATGRTTMPRALARALQYAHANADTLSALQFYRALSYWQPFNANLAKIAEQYAFRSPAYDAALEPLVLQAAARTGSVEHLNALTAIRLRQRRLNEARAVLAALEERDPASGSMLYNTARLLYLQGDSAGARLYLQRYRAVNAGPRQ